MVGACCGADFGERPCPSGLNCDARIHGFYQTVLTIESLVMLLPDNKAFTILH